MKILQKIALFSFIIASFVTCKKEVLAPSTIEGQPVFSFSGNIGGTNLNLQAGVNNYYMYSSYTQDSGVYNFIGTLKSTSNSNNSLEIIINDYKSSTLNASVASHIDSSLSTTAPYYYNIPGGNSINYSVTFKPIIYAGYPQTFSYLFGDGGTAFKTDTTSVTHVYSKLETYPTSLSVKFINDNGKVLTISNPVNLIKKSLSFKVDSIHFVVKIDNGTLKTDSLTACFTGGTPTYRYGWSFGDGQTGTSTSASVTHTYTVSAKSDTTYLATVAVLDGNGDTASYTGQVADTTGPDSSTCRMNYRISLPAPVPNPTGLSNVTVNYTDALGNKYTSNNSAQPNASTFQVLSVAPYQNNINNNPTKMLKVTFNCWLYPVLGGSPIQAVNCTAIIAAAYH